MGFEEFKKRYLSHMIDEKAAPSDEKLAEIFIGLCVFAEWQHEEMTKAQAKATHKELLKLLRKEENKNV